MSAGKGSEGENFSPVEKSAGEGAAQTNVWQEIAIQHQEAKNYASDGKKDLESGGGSDAKKDKASNETEKTSIGSTKDKDGADVFDNISSPYGNDQKHTDKHGDNSKADSSGLSKADAELAKSLGLPKDVSKEKLNESFNEMMANGLDKQRQQIKTDNELIKTLGLSPNASRAKLDESYNEMLANGLDKQREQVKTDNELIKTLGLSPNATRAKLDESYNEMLANGLDKQRSQVKTDNHLSNLLGLPPDARRADLNKAFEEMVAIGAEAYRQKYGTKQREGD